MATTDRSHPVVFTTQTAYPLPSQKFMIPASWKRYQLSQLVNKALSLEKPIPFDFLVRGEILRTTLGEWCSEKGIGEEETLEIEYFESVMPPQKMSSLPHEDWVSSVSARLPGHFVTASYDGQLRIFDYSQKLLSTIPLHEAPATSITIVPNFDENSHLIASGSHDLTARLTKVSLSDPSSSETASHQTLASLHLHTAPISSISANTSGKQLLTASWDGLIGLWDTIIPASDEVLLEETGERKKRRKIANGDSEQKVKRKAPLNVLKSHTARVSKAVFVGQGKEAVSAGLDETVRTWDVENGVCVNTITASAKPFLDLAVLPSQRTILAASTDRTVSQFDLRTSESSTTTTASAIFMHPSTPSCIAIPSSSTANSIEHQFMTGAYDGITRLWDLRSTKGAVTSFKVWDAKSGGSGKKVLGLDWYNGVAVIGGEGGVDVWRVGMGERSA